MQRWFENWTGFTFESPHALWLLLVALPVVLIVARQSLAALGWTRRWLAMAVRCVVVTLLVAALAGVQRVQTTDRQTAIFVLDRSRSIAPEDQQQQEALIRQATAPGKVPTDDRVGVLTFAGNANIEQPPMKGAVYFDRLANPSKLDQSDLARAIRLAVATFPTDATKRLVIMSDGNQNAGDVLAEVAAAKSAGVRVDVVPVRYDRQNEVLIEQLALPATGKMGEYARLRLTLRSTRATRGEMSISLRTGNRVVPVRLSDAQRRLELEPGINVFPGPSDPPIDIRLDHPGVTQVEAVFTPAEGEDSIAPNNRATAFVNVESKGRVLILSQPDELSIDDAAQLIAALRSEQIEAVGATPSELQLSLINLQSFDAVLMSNVPAALVPDEAQAALRAYVFELGGGLAMIGGDAAFGAGGWNGSPLAEALPVDLEVKQRRELPRGALAIIAHSCEMPRGNYWGEQTAIAAVNALSNQDWVGVVSFDHNKAGFGGYDWAVKMQKAINRPSIIADIKRMVIGDMPDFTRPMDLAIDGLRGTDAAQKHMIIISDGDPQLANLQAMVAKMKNAKITITCVEVFPHWPPGVNQKTTMQTLAEALVPPGAARPAYYFINSDQSAQSLPQIFIKSATLIRRPLIREQPFTPQMRTATSDMLIGLGGSLPRLGGYVLTTRKPKTEVPIVAEGKDEDPVMAHWQHGRGKVVAFTSGLWNRWGQTWLDWQQFAKFWGQTTRWLMRQSKEAGLFDITTRIDGDRARIVVEAVEPDGSFVSADRLDLGGALVAPDGQAVRVDLEQTGPGRFEADVKLERQGDYVLDLPYTLRHEDGSERASGSIRSGLSMPYSPEYRDLIANEPLLRQIADRGGGQLVERDQAGEHDFFARDLEPIRTLTPIWWPALMLGMFLFVADVAVRRISIDWPGMCARFTQMLASLAGRRPEGTREVERARTLLERRGQVRETLVRRTAPDPEPDRLPSGQMRASRGEPPTAELPLDVPTTDYQPPAATPDPAEGGLSRLRKAKQKAQEKMRDQDNLG